MLKMVIPMILLLPTTMLCKSKQLWPTTLTHSFWIALLSLQWFKPSTELMIFSNCYLGVDQISAPFLILSCWLTPMMIMAGQNNLIMEPTPRKRTFIFITILLQISLILAFSTTELIMFFIAFESTLLPTLVIITRWGGQMERLNAGIYFLFYTLIGSLPLLVALLTTQAYSGTLSICTLQLSTYPNTMNPWTHTMWWLALFTAFMIKMPLYGLHLWLPKAHVEAPIAGSMILAAVLLKLGGYGIIRMTMTLAPPLKMLSYPFMTLALWGVIMTGFICLRQTDLKSLIAYSSVGHMGLVIAATLTRTEWACTGAITLMIAHGLTSSMLFCLANTNYERTNSRTLLLARNMQLLLPLMGLWWFSASLTNMALPPTINLMGELTIIVSLFNWSNITILMTGLGTLMAATYTLYMLITTQWGETPSHMKTIPPTHTREHLLMMLHTLPMALLMMQPELIQGA
uniref:NADH-ubiquinone oxidoreductase chain 4 n=6 Tax=Cuora TaxID=72005 RepID=I1SZC0_9SAUR|nr:NADH dehydrogenase subunit 4 [Cuora picturata]YP_006303362.1 NADH dehydrogenase subunit 4 [Cuora bourreti]AEB54998.1 NADH dehydrogenase subunit 4 [Cuora picturata]AEI26124.1 NADH dehydrogenase subunit 4 [Cuora bourreti]AEV21849.1 NADH dehydrogenase subunit 4 [Cuora bourreti]AIC09032.1 NADH dehydrogenase subunit 4 [Cuora picturata]